MYKILNNILEMDDYSLQRLTKTSSVIEYIWYKLWGNTVQSSTPTPQNPVEVKGVGERTANLLTQNYVHKGLNWSDGTINDTIMTNRLTTMDFSDITSGQVTAAVYDANSNSYDGVLLAYDSNGNYTGNYQAWHALPYTWTVGSNTKVRMCVKRSNNYDIADDTKIMLNTGSTAKPYEPYEYKIPVNVRSENLFDINDNLITTNGVSKQGEYLIFDYENTTTSTKENQAYTNNLDLKSNTYYLCVAEIIEVIGSGKFRPITSWDSQNQGQFAENGANFPLNGLHSGQKIFYISKTKSDLSNITRGLRTMTTFEPGESGYLKVRLSILADTTINENNFKYQPYYNETKNVYIEEPLHKIGDYADILSYSEHNVVRKIKKLVLTGEEYWITTKVGSNTFFQTVLSNGLAEYRAILSNIYVGSNAGGALRPDNSIRQIVYNNISMVSIRHSAYTTVEDYKYYLATQYANGTPVTVWYVLANEETEQIKAPDILADKYTSITVDTEVQPSQADFSTKGKHVPQPSLSTARKINAENKAKIEEEKTKLIEETKKELEEPIEKEESIENKK